jgi:hypothetical protein
MPLRRRSVPHTFQDRIADQKSSLEERAAKLPLGPEKDQLRRNIRQLDTASYMADLLKPLRLKSPHDA